MWQLWVNKPIEDLRFWKEGWGTPILAFYLHAAESSINYALFQGDQKPLFGFYNDGLSENIFWSIHK